MEARHPTLLNWSDVAAWRKSERERLIADRLAIPVDRRVEMTRTIVSGIETVMGSPAGRTVSIYWPFRGEPDLRLWIDVVVERGGQIALPVVVEKGKPLEFRPYRPGDTLEKGVWNIPVPTTKVTAAPDVVIAPVVGWDRQNYRLGYGGGFFDRTLAALPRKPLVIGIGYGLQHIQTIHPQSHDIPMDVIVTEDGVARP